MDESYVEEIVSAARKASVTQQAFAEFPSMRPTNN